MLRILLIPAFVVVASAQADNPDATSRGRIAAFGLLLLLALSDVVDGWIARRFGLSTPLGALLDAVADKLAQVALLAFFTFTDGVAFARVPVWFFVLIVGRDLLLATGSMFVKARHGNVEVIHEQHGKLASFTVFVLLIWLAVGAPQIGVDIAVFAIACFVALSTWQYVRAGWRQFTR